MARPSDARVSRQAVLTRRRPADFWALMADALSLGIAIPIEHDEIAIAQMREQVAEAKDRLSWAPATDEVRE